MSKDLFEKDKTIRLALLSAVAGESIFLLGPPGVAKSMIARRLKYAFKEARSFEYLMGRFSTPDEVFGPVSISKLKNDDTYERLTQHYLPGAQIVFLDEIWKASPPIQNALLTVLNEKIYRNGAQEVSLDIRGLIAASNELPLQGEGLEALWDRFLIRLVVRGIREEENFYKMVLMPKTPHNDDPVPAKLKIDHKTYAGWGKGIDQVQVPMHILGILSALRKLILDYNAQAESQDRLYVSDRRWKKIVRLLRTSAFLNGRPEVDVMDCFLIGDCIWDNEQQIEQCEKLVSQAILHFGYSRLLDLPLLLAELNKLKNEIDRLTLEVRKVEEEEPKIYKDAKGDTYFKVMRFWGDDSAFIRVEDFRRLGEKESFIPIYEPAGKNFKPFQTYGITRKSEHFIGTKSKDLKLETIKVEREIKSRIKPSPQNQTRWDKMIELLLDRCKDIQKSMEIRKHKESAYLSEHLFVPKERGVLVQKSMEHALNDLVNARLEIEKTQHGYQAITEGTR